MSVIMISGCRYSDKLDIVPLRSAGRPLPHPAYNIDQCKAEGSLETLQSIRYVEPGYLYYMDYTADVDMDRMIYPVYPPPGPASITPNSAPCS